MILFSAPFAIVTSRSQSIKLKLYGKLMPSTRNIIAILLFLLLLYLNSAGGHKTEAPIALECNRK